MQGSFNEFNATHQNLQSLNLDLQLVSHNYFEEDRSKQPVQFKCSLLDLPETDQYTFPFFFKNGTEQAQPDFLRRQKFSIANLSHNSIFNLDNMTMPANPVFKANKPEMPDHHFENGSLSQLKTLLISRLNIFENDNCFEPLPSFQKTDSIKPLEDKSNRSDRVTCHCKKSKCLRLYCECFAKGQICGLDCNCADCHNTQTHKDLRDQVIQETLEKNPFAFKSKYKTMKENDKILHSRGCNCSKTGCVKKYCECYNAGIGCSRLCKCTGCKNVNIELEDSEVRVYYDRVLRKRSKKSVLESIDRNEINRTENTVFEENF